MTAPRLTDATWPKRKRDTYGRFAVVLRKLRSNGGFTIPVGTVVKLHSYYQGWHVRALGGNITRIQTSDLRLLP